MTAEIPPTGLESALLMSGAKSFGPMAANMAGSVLAAAGRGLKQAYSNVTSSYGLHLKTTFERCTKIKILLNPDEPLQLLSIYVNSKFISQKRELTDFDVIDEIRAKKRAVISGTAGGGKTIFMKYLWLSFFENPQGRIPIFIELRRLNEITTDDIITYIYHTITAAHSTISLESFMSGIKDGLFVFLLDGFDEITPDKRDEIEKQILSLAHNNPNCIVIVSGRPDERFNSWQYFSNYRVQPLDKKSVISLIEKLPYDTKVKRKFIGRLNKDLFERHGSFLSTPLLSTLMLITFNQYADIPEKIHVFYEQAFDTLFARHDAMKEAFKRRMYSDLPIDVFKRYISLFCLVTYYEGKYEFKDADVALAVEQALKIENVTIDKEKFIKDLMESMCLLQRDGLDISFTHRSFQEFFAAYCLARTSNSNFGVIINTLARRIASDSVILMLRDMNEEALLSNYIVPRLERIVEDLKKSSSDRVLAAFGRIFGDTVTINLHGTRRAFIGRLYLGRNDEEGDNFFVREVCRSLYFEFFSDFDFENMDKLDQLVVGEFVREIRKKKLKVDGFYTIGKGKPLVAVPSQNPEIRLDAEWLERSGYRLYVAHEREFLISLYDKIQADRLRRDRTINQIFRLT